MDKDLDGSDYNVVATITEDSFMSGPMGIQESPTTSKRQVLKGVNLPKGGSTKMSVKTHSIIHTQYGDVSTFKNARVEFTLSPEKLVEKYYTPTGDEYKAYLEKQEIIPRRPAAPPQTHKRSRAHPPRARLLFCRIASRQSGRCKKMHIPPRAAAGSGGEKQESRLRVLGSRLGF